MTELSNFDAATTEDQKRMMLLKRLDDIFSEIYRTDWQDVDDINELMTRGCELTVFAEQKEPFSG